MCGVLGPKSNAHGPNEFLHVPYARRLTAAVAQVIAYVFSLASYGRERPPLAPPVVDLPSSMRFDVDGRHETSGPRS